jgi:hypothetical protein
MFCRGEIVAGHGALGRQGISLELGAWDLELPVLVAGFLLTAVFSVGKVSARFKQKSVV